MNSYLINTTIGKWYRYIEYEIFPINVNSLFDIMLLIKLFSFEKTKISTTPNRGTKDWKLGDIIFFCGTIKIEMIKKMPINEKKSLLIFNRLKLKLLASRL